MQKGRKRPMIALNMAPMELNCDVDGTIDKYNEINKIGN